MQDQEGERPEWEQQRGPCRRLESGRLRKEEEEQRQDAVRVVQAAVGQLSECVCVCVCQCQLLVEHFSNFYIIELYFGLLHLQNSFNWLFPRFLVRTKQKLL